VKKYYGLFTLISFITLLILYSIEIPDKQYKAYGHSKYWEIEIRNGGVLCFTNKRPKIITSDIKYLGANTPTNISYELFLNDSIFTRIEGVNSVLQLDYDFFKNIKLISGWNLYNTVTLKSKLNSTHILVSWEENSLYLEEKIFLKVVD
jgi:hypothetical protein